MIILENFEFFKFVEIVLFFFMNELYQLQVFNDGHVNKEAIEDLLVNFEVVVVDLYH